ncbi:MAG TPA: hypothetical protein VMF61_04485 [Candidatus Acidoferrales bacterium]|nr:hypothetical protein [Candidatus Acidoferrales bacterium]
MPAPTLRSMASKLPQGTLLVAFGTSRGGVVAYKPPYRTKYVSMLGMMEPRGLALSTTGDLLVADQNAGVMLWSPPYRKGTTLFAVAGYGAAALDAKNDLFIADTAGNAGVYELPPPWTKASLEINSSYTDYPAALAIDSRQGLFVDNAGGKNVVYFPPPYKHLSAVVTNVASSSSPQAIAVDRLDRLFAVNDDEVDVFPAPYNGKGKITISTGIAGARSLVLDKHGTLFVANAANTSSGYGSIAVFKPPYGKPSITIRGSGVNDPEALAVDDRDDLFVGNHQGGRSAAGFVAMYEPPYTRYTRIDAGITAGVNDLILSP